MNSRIVSILATLGAAAPLALAQAQSNPPVTVTYHLSWVEASATAPYAPVANPNGMLEPGEGARFTFYASFDPPPGTPLTYPASLTPGSAGAGLLGGLLTGYVNLTGDQASPSAAGSWILNQNTVPSGNPNRLGVLPPFAAGYPTSSGVPSASGAVLADITPAQFGGDPSSYNSVSPSPPMWRGLWVPASYAPRSASFELGLGSSGQHTHMFVWDNAVTWSYITTYSAYSSVTVPIIPAPPVLAAFGLSASLMFRPRRGCGPQRSRA
jgi:hypothetical protein